MNSHEINYCIEDEMSIIATHGNDELNLLTMLNDIMCLNACVLCSLQLENGRR